MSPANWSYRIKPEVEDLLRREDSVRTALWLERLTIEGRRGIDG